VNVLVADPVLESVNSDAIHGVPKTLLGAAFGSVDSKNLADQGECFTIPGWEIVLVPFSYVRLGIRHVLWPVFVIKPGQRPGTGGRHLLLPLRLAYVNAIQG